MSDIDEARPHSASGDADGTPHEFAATINPSDSVKDAESHEAADVSAISTSGVVNADLGNEGSGEEDEGDVASAAKQNAEDLKDLIAGNDVKNIILQVTSPYLDDNGGLDDDVDGADGDVNHVDDDGNDSSAQRYDHIKSKMWIQLICDGIMERLVALGKPYKFIVHCMIMRKNGAGMHVCSSCLYGHTDGWVNHAHDLSTHIYAIVTVYWSAI